MAFSHVRWSNNRSVMPLDVWGCTRTTMGGSACVYPALRGAGNPLNPACDRDWGLKLFPINEKFPVITGHKLALIKSLPFGHTARRYYRLDGLVRSSDRDSQRRGGGGCGGARELHRTRPRKDHRPAKRSEPTRTFRSLGSCVDEERSLLRELM